MEKLEELIETIRPHILKLFKGESSGHDIEHLERTKAIALKICEKEGGDRVVVGVASFMHDIHRVLKSTHGGYVSPEESLFKVREILSYTTLDEKKIERICYAIRFHEEYNWNGNNVTDLNTLILQDADNLDAIGAIGIGRTFAFGGAYGVKMYDASVPLKMEEDFIEGSADPSTIHHFYHKLFKLGDNMNTKTGRKIARQRTNFMKNFIEQFLAEWNGER